MRNLLISLVIGSLFFAFGCQQDSASNTSDGPKVTEIKTDGENISDIIRNPVSADQPVDTINVPKITFEEDQFDFGTIKEGDVVEHTFKFTNTGKTALLINNARSTCGCTIPEWPKTPIQPGESNQIQVRFDSKGKAGRQNKPVTITANTYPNTTSISIVGEVVGKNGASTAKPN